MIAIGDVPEPFFADVVDHMADVCRADLAIVALADPPRQWVSGLNDGRGGEAPAGFPFYACEILGRGAARVCIVEEPVRPGAEPAVHGGRLIRAFLSRTLVLRGVDVGNLYLAQYEPRDWSDFDVRYLERSSRLIAAHFEARMTANERDRLLAVERELSSQSALYQTVVAAMREGVVVHSATGEIIASNDAACRILGLTQDQLHGRTSMDPRWMAVDEIGAPLSGDRHPAMTALATGRPVADFLMGVVQPDGDRSWIRVNASPIFPPGADRPDRVVATFVDVTEKRRHVEELSAALRRAEEASVSKQRFLANMSHEIRTPLNGVLGMAQAMRQGPLDAEQAQQIDIILDCGRGLMTVLNDTLDFSKLEAGQFRIEPMEEDLGEAMDAVLHLWRPRAEEAGLELSLTVDPCARRRLSFDGVRVRQCVSNLVSNAIKFTPSGSVSMTVGLQARPDGGAMVSVSVRDSGIGLTASGIARLFQPFQQADNSIARRFGGTGLGLSLVKRLAELMGGGVEVASEPGQGACFVLTFLAEAGVADVGEVALPAVTQAVEGEPERSLAGLRILLADDNRVNRMVVQMFLKRCGLAASEAATGREALERLAREAFDLVLMDIHMPEMDGLEATRAIRAGGNGPPDLPVIALTADALVGDRERLMDAGFTDYLPKPIVERDLIEAIRRAIPGVISRVDVASRPLAMA